MSEDEKLLPCPFCGADSVPAMAMNMNGTRYYRQCNSCNMQGPDGNTREERDAAWNARVPLPRPDIAEVEKKAEAWVKASVDMAELPGWASETSADEGAHELACAEFAFKSALRSLVDAGRTDEQAEARARTIANSVAIKEGWGIGSQMWNAVRVGAFYALRRQQANGQE